jgi:hypothetical protein
MYDTPSVAPSDLGDPSEDDFGADAGAFIAKLVGLGPLAGLISAGLEGLLPGTSGFEGYGTRDVPTPDEAPAAAGAGKTVRPAGLPILDGGTDVQDWTSQQGLELDGRRYYYLVDRVNQTWWPADDHASGFRGRWGQHVTRTSCRGVPARSFRPTGRCSCWRSPTATPVSCSISAHNSRHVFKRSSL